MKDKFILERLRPIKYAQDDMHPRIRVSQDAYGMLTDVAVETGLSLSKIASKAIKFAIDRIEYVDLE